MTPLPALRLRSTTVLLGLAALLPATAHADIVTYYFGVDARTTPVAAGTYAGLPWANSGRLTLLIGHDVPDNPADNHFHEAAIWTYTGPNLGAATAVRTRADNYFPAASGLPLALVPGTGAYAGKLVPLFTDLGGEGHNYSDLRFRPVSTLAGFEPDSAEDVLLHYAGGRWSTDLSTADLQFRLVSLSPGLHVGTADGLTFDLVTQPGDRVALGEEFAPVFWTTPSSVAGEFIAAFQLVDVSGQFGDSGVFEFRFRAEVAAIPEPATWTALLGAGALGLGLVARRRRSRAVRPAA